MTYIYRLAGEKPRLAERELKGFLKSQGIKEEVQREGRIAFTEGHPNRLKRLALTHEISEKIELKDYRPEESYAVKTHNLTEEEINHEKRKDEIGQKLSNSENEVDLENPDTVIQAYILKEKTVFGIERENIPRGKFDERKNQNRPFSSPVSLDPVLARVMINLSEASAGESILDPFCGTGGILIEAGLCGILPKGLDIQEKMVEGNKENLERYGILNHKIKEGDISKIEKKFEEFDALVTDLPYGKASKKSEKAVEKFLDLIDNFDGKAVFMYNEPEVGSYSSNFEIYQHKNLTRYIFIAK